MKRRNRRWQRDYGFFSIFDEYRRDARGERGESSHLWFSRVVSSLPRHFRIKRDTSGVVERTRLSMEITCASEGSKPADAPALSTSPLDMVSRWKSTDLFDRKWKKNNLRITATQITLSPWFFSSSRIALRYSKMNTHLRFLWNIFSRKKIDRRLIEERVIVLCNSGNSRLCVQGCYKKCSPPHIGDGGLSSSVNRFAYVQRRVI